VDAVLCSVQTVALPTSAGLVHGGTSPSSDLILANDVRWHAAARKCGDQALALRMQIRLLSSRGIWRESGLTSSCLHAVRVEGFVRDRSHAPVL
jgi:hypothetical protein